MILLTMSAIFVGMVHSLAPGHWLPVVLVTKSKRWGRGSAALGALVAASGHILVSVIIGLVGIVIGIEIFTHREEEIERWGGLAVALFGLAYAGYAYYRHRRCRGHSHHGPRYDDKRTPFAFLFSLGLSPCVAVLPVFAAAAPYGIFAIVLAMIGFAIGVITALTSATLLVSYGIMRLDHPILEHYGDVITGAAIAFMGVVLFLLPH